MMDLYTPRLIPDSAFDGRYLAFITVEGNTYNGAFGQSFKCELVVGYTYSFSVALALIWGDVVPSFYKPGPISIYLGNNTCSYDELIFTSPILDTIWKVYEIEFTPAMNLNALIFRGVPNNVSMNYNVDIDALSPIYVVNAHQIHTYQQDTVLPIGSSACINLNAYADAAYDSVWWEQQGVGVISHQLNAGVHCVDSTTTFIVHIMGNDSTCAGYLPSSDTIHIKFYDPNSISEPLSKNSIQVSPNPATDNINFKIYLSPEQAEAEIKIYNALGALVHRFTANETWSNYPWAVKNVANGLYFYDVTSNQSILAKGKIIVQH